MWVTFHQFFQSVFTSSAGYNFEKSIWYSNSRHGMVMVVKIINISFIVASITKIKI